MVGTAQERLCPPYDFCGNAKILVWVPAFAGTTILTDQQLNIETLSK
jgi:hypothetical protein